MTKIFFLLLACLSMGICNAQNVSYYKLTRIQQNGTSNKDVSGGQFITFSGSICFESNKKGLSIGNGTLNRNENYSNSQYAVYQGSSYWGSNTTFKFNADKSVLNVVLDNGDVYVYKRATPPQDVTTCSLIRKPSSSNRSDGGYHSGHNPTPTPQQSSYQQPKPSNPSNPDNPRKIVKEQVRCSRCNGTGKMVYNSYPSMLGTPDNQVYCSTCGRNYSRSTGHSHVTCTECHGSGTVTRTRVN